MKSRYPLPRIVAHRGASGDAPENTMAAILEAWRQGADGVEVDVHLSRDGRLVVHHDDSLLRTTGLDAAVADTDWETIAALDAGAWFGPAFVGQRVPTLDQVFQATPDGAAVLVEFKGGDERLWDVFGELLDLHCSRIAISVLCFDAEFLQEFRQRWPDIACLWVREAQLGTNDYPCIYDDRLAQNTAAVALQGLSVDHQGIDSGFAQAVRDSALALVAWTVNDYHEARRLAAIGIDVLTTDFPERTRKAIES